MKSYRENKNNLTEELLKSFHIQFAENQRTREQSFLKIVGFLGAVIFGYTYVYENISSKIAEFSLVTFGSISLLAFGSAIVTVIAYSFRRDQYVNARIRRKAKIIGPSKPFPPDYDPSHIYDNKIKKYTWMPDIFLVFYFIFPFFQLILLVSYCHKIGIHLVQIRNADIWITVVIFLSIGFIFATLVMPYCFSIKLKKKIQKWEIEYEKDIIVKTNKKSIFVLPDA